MTIQGHKWLLSATTDTEPPVLVCAVYIDTEVEADTMAQMLEDSGYIAVVLPAYNGDINTDITVQ